MDGPGRQALAAVHHAGRLRRPQGRARHALGGRAEPAGCRAPHGPGHRGVSQGVAGPRRHRGRRHLPLRPATLHRQHGVATAINVGDYLLGLGYRLVGRERKELGGDCTADILNRLADAHLKLSEGQGAELLWRDAKDKTLTALDALKIYALKTAPAFEAALYAGVRLAGPADAHEKMIAEFSKNLGVAFQILNDLKDWDGDADNKLTAGQDVLAARPTLLLALALEGSSPADRAELMTLLHGRRDAAEAAGVVGRVRQLFTQAQVFDKAEKLMEKFRAAPRRPPTRRSRPSCASCSIIWSITSSTANRRRSRRRPP